GRKDSVITSAWGIGVLTYDGGSLTSLTVQRNGTKFGRSGNSSGDWVLDTLLNSIEGFGDFDSDGNDDILIRSDSAIAILTFDQAAKTFTSRMRASNGTTFGLWKFNASKDRVAAIANFDGGLSDEILIVNDSGLAIIGRRTWDASELTSLTTAENGCRLGGWLLDTRSNSIGTIVYDLVGDMIVIRSAWGIGVLTLRGSMLTTKMLAPNGTRFGGWLYNLANDQVHGAAGFVWGLDQGILVTS